MLNVGINGICGRMGNRLAHLVHKQKGMRLTLALERNHHPNLGKDIGLILGFNQPVNVTLASTKNYVDTIARETDVIIDFSTPKAILLCLELCIKHKIAFLVGTTGLTKTILRRINQASKKIPCLISPNFSLGANMLMKYAAELTRQLGSQYDIALVESHHRTKKDMPSGTALRLAQKIQANLHGKTKPCAIPIHALRIGNVIGEHTVIFGGQNEVLELTHRAQSRDAFARGAIECARILAKSKPKLYGLEEIMAQRFN